LYEILKPGGTLRLGVPDFGGIVDYYQKTKDLRAVSGMLYGGQDYMENNHFWVWDFDTLKKELIQVGFKDVHRYDWRQTDHNHVDDYTQSYLPHMDKEKGTLLSLNVEAIK
jgi:predicted SAM-dependent methyltransferase